MWGILYVHDLKCQYSPSLKNPYNHLLHEGGRLGRAFVVVVIGAKLKPSLILQHPVYKAHLFSDFRFQN